MKKVIFIFIFIFILFGCKKKNKVYEIDNDYIYFGSYPQTLITDEEQIKNLNTNINLDDLSNLTSYEYYCNGIIEDYMYYIDIDSNNDGAFDYRGIYFDKYRPYKFSLDSEINKTYQDDNGYLVNTVYWFKYEKIKWKILKKNKKSAMIISDLILDSQDYYPSDRWDLFEHNGKVGYVNNYELSNIRKWLNDNFYNTAFNTLEKEIIKTTKVDNSLESTTRISNDYICDNTLDKVFLLSHKELNDYFKTEEERQNKATNYASSQGISTGENGYSYWRLRTPYTNFVGRDTLINHEGKIFNLGVDYNCYGIRPAINIKL